MTEVNAWGGLPKQYQVVVDPPSSGPTGSSLKRGVRGGRAGQHATPAAATSSTTASSTCSAARDWSSSLADIEKIVLKAEAGGHADHGRERGPGARGGDAAHRRRDCRRRGETVIGLVQMLAGENALEVADAGPPSRRGAAAVAARRASGSFRTTTAPIFVRRVIRTVRDEPARRQPARRSPCSSRSSATCGPASSSPPPSRSRCCLAFTGMVESGISANLMSLGAIDFGLIVDGAVVLVENVVRRLSEPEGREKTVRQLTAEAAHEVVRPIAFGIGIIILVYLPILTLGGIEGKMFKPMAWTVVFALAGSLAADADRSPRCSPRSSSRRPAMSTSRASSAGCATSYLRGSRLLHGASDGRSLRRHAVGRRSWRGVLGALTLGGRVHPPPRRGRSRDQRRPARLRSGISEVAASTGRIERVLKRFPEVITVVSRSGSPELATDVMGIELGDVFVILKPQVRVDDGPDQGRAGREDGSTRWTETVPGCRLLLHAADRDALQRADRRRPLRRRHQALRRRPRDAAQRRARRSRAVVRGVPGAADVKLEQTAGLPVMRVKVDRDRCARYGISVGDVLDTVEAARAGKIVGHGVRRAAPLLARRPLRRRDRADARGARQRPRGSSPGWRQRAAGAARGDQPRHGTGPDHPRGGAAADRGRAERARAGRGVVRGRGAGPDPARGAAAGGVLHPAGAGSSRISRRPPGGWRSWCRWRWP